VPRIAIASLADLRDGHGVVVRVGGLRLAVFRVGDGVYVLDDVCPHRGFPLHDGVINAGSVQCRTHGSCFNLASGAVERGPAHRGVRTYPVAVVGDRIELDVGDGPL
jgi:nitrite reductase/ring-hydroxylating ferredoxin subunit